MSNHRTKVVADISSTQCSCNPEQKQLAQSLFMNVKAEPRSLPTTKSDRSITLDQLPREILHTILKIVYDDEEMSRNLCACTRPKSPYAKVRKSALEHRIVNTLILRNVCHAFHAWALNEILRGHPFDDRIGKELEVDFSDLKRLQRKFSNSGGVVSRLVVDFPGVRESGVRIYLGSPGDVENMKLVVETLKKTHLNVFSGVSLWDLDYYSPHFTSEFIRFLAPGATGESMFLIDDTDKYYYFMSSEEQDFRDAGNMKTLALSQWARDAWRIVAHQRYSDDQLIFQRLLSLLYLRNWGHSKVHIPMSAVLDLTAQESDRQSIAGLIRGCTSVVFREFMSYPVLDWEPIKATIESQLDGSDSEPPWIDPDILSQFRFDDIDWENRTKAFGKWCGMSLQVSKHLDASRIEFRHLDTTGLWLQPPQNFLTLSPTFKALEECVIFGGTSVRLRLGSVLKALLPVAKTLKKFIWRTKFYGKEEVVRIEENPDHTCLLLRQFSNLRTLEVRSRICPTLFEDIGDAVDGASEEPRTPEQRNWLFDGLGVCDWVEMKRAEAIREAARIEGRQTEGAAPDQIPDRGSWPVSREMEELAVSCQLWKAKNEDRHGSSLDWNINVHISVRGEATETASELLLINDEVTACSHHPGNCTTVDLLA